MKLDIEIKIQTDDKDQLPMIVKSDSPGFVLITLSDVNAIQPITGKISIPQLIAAIKICEQNV